MSVIENPVLLGEDFNRHWDQAKYENFCDKISVYYGKMKDAYKDEDHNSSIRKWRKVFGDKFGKIVQNNSSLFGNGVILYPFLLFFLEGLLHFLFFRLGGCSGCCLAVLRLFQAVVGCH